MEQVQEPVPQPDVLREAELLRQKRDLERSSLSKTQLKKARKKLTKLYQKALGKSGADNPNDVSTAVNAVEDAAGQLQDTTPCVSHADGEAGSIQSRQPEAQHGSVHHAVHGHAHGAPAPKRHKAAPGPSTTPAAAANGSTDEATLTNVTVPGGMGTSVAAVGGATGIITPRAAPLPGRVPPRGAADMSHLVRMLQQELRPAPAAAPAADEGSAQGGSDRSEAAGPSAAHDTAAEQHTGTAGKPDPARGKHPPRSHTHGAPNARPSFQTRAGPQHLSRPQSSNVSSAGGAGRGAKRQREFIYGNYHGYYGYRHASFEAFDDDPRLALLRPEWFAGRAMLDVGCNEGLVTLAVAARYGCDSATGVDIDRVLIGKASRNLRTLRSQVAEQMKQCGSGGAAMSGGSAGSAGLHRLSQSAYAEGHAAARRPGQQGAGAVLEPQVAAESSVQQQASVQQQTPQGSQQSAQPPQPSTQPLPQLNPQAAEAAAGQEAGQQQHNGPLLSAQEQAQQHQAQAGTHSSGQPEPQLAPQAAPSSKEQQPPSSRQGAGLIGANVSQPAAGQGRGSGLPLPRTLMPPPERPARVPWVALRTAARALSHVTFIGMDWANEDMPGTKRKGSKAASPAQLALPTAGASGGLGGAGPSTTVQAACGNDGCTSARSAPSAVQPAAAAQPATGASEAPPTSGTTGPAADQQPTSSGRSQQPSSGGGTRQLRVPKRFGVIMCLSVTKWVHINWGDEGLMRLFHKFWSHLEPGGYLVLEPQPWRSYCAAITKRHTAGGRTARDLAALTLRPEGFLEILQGLGFVLLADLNKGSTAIGFDRPMYVLEKPGGKKVAQTPAALSAQPIPSGGACAGGAQQQQGTESVSQRPHSVTAVALSQHAVSQRVSQLSQQVAVSGVSGASARTGSRVSGSQAGGSQKRGTRAGRQHRKGSVGSVRGSRGVADHVRQHTADDLLMAGDDMDMEVGEEGGLEGGMHFNQQGSQGEGHVWDGMDQLGFQ